jgi:hypothetical protein
MGLNVQPAPLDPPSSEARLQSLAAAFPRLASNAMDDRRITSTPVDLLHASGSGPLWGMASRDLNATLLAWPAADGVAEHVNVELDVLLIVLDGSGIATVDRREHTITRGSALLIEKGSVRAIRAGPSGIRYLTVHRRRGALQLTDSRADR